MSKVDVTPYINEATGLVPVKFLGVPLPGTDDGTGKPQRAGEAGLGLRVGEIRGVGPDVAVNMIELGTAELVKVDAKKAAAAKAPAA